MHRPRKRFGQNFLKSTAVIQRIVRTINPQSEDVIVEIGPGKGALTRALLQHTPTLDAIEIDADLIPILTRNCPGLRLHHADILSFSLKQLLASMPSPTQLRLVGNLPYNITTPLLFHLFDSIHLIQDMHFMVQREVAQRLAAHTHTKAYGRLSVMAQYHCTIAHLFDVGPEHFSPAPTVWSSVIRLTPHPTNHYPPVPHPQLSDIVRTAFQQRRKMIRNSLKNHCDPATLRNRNIDPNARPETLNVSDFIKIAEKVEISKI